MSEPFFNSTQTGSALQFTELIPLIDPIFNNSSQGETYTDVAGDTYGTTAGATAITMPATRATRVSQIGSWHVNAGTGTLQVYNSTDASEVHTITTTSTSEVTFGATSSCLSTNIGDSLILRLKNSGAGNTVTVDLGGLVAADGIALANVTASGSANVEILSFRTLYDTQNLAVRNIKIYFLKRISSATFSGEIASFGAVPNVADTTQFKNSILTFDESDHAILNSITLNRMVKPDSTGAVRLLRVAAVSATNVFACIVTSDGALINI